MNKGGVGRCIMGEISFVIIQPCLKAMEQDILEMGSGIECVAYFT
jgi:hypothetical protein